MTSQGQKTLHTGGVQYCYALKKSRLLFYHSQDEYFRLLRLAVALRLLTFLLEAVARLLAALLDAVAFLRASIMLRLAEDVFMHFVGRLRVGLFLFLLRVP